MQLVRIISRARSLKMYLSKAVLMRMQFKYPEDFIRSFPWTAIVLRTAMFSKTLNFTFQFQLVISPRSPLPVRKTQFISIVSQIDKEPRAGCEKMTPASKTPSLIFDESESLLKDGWEEENNCGGEKPAEYPSCSMLLVLNFLGRKVGSSPFAVLYFNVFWNRSLSPKLKLDPIHILYALPQIVWMRG